MQWGMFIEIQRVRWWLFILPSANMVGFFAAAPGRWIY